MRQHSDFLHLTTDYFIKIGRALTGSHATLLLFICYIIVTMALKTNCTKKQNETVPTYRAFYSSCETHDS